MRAALAVVPGKGWTKIALVPRIRGRNEKIDQGWPKNTVCARKPGHKPRFLARGGQKLRLCPEIWAGTKKLSRGGQKTPFVPANLGTNPDVWPGVEQNCLCAEK
ncbi:MAG: hypothetical protein QM296_10540 [Bacillota bacterium]|nr:hypothetical protein [Bacillota bacterium]